MNRTWLSSFFFSTGVLSFPAIGFSLGFGALGFFFLSFCYVGFAVPLLLFATVCTIDKNIHLAGSLLIHFLVEHIQEEKNIPNGSEVISA